MSYTNENVDSSEKKNKFKSMILSQKKFNIQSLNLYFGLIILVVIFTILCNMRGTNFLSINNISNIIVQSSIISIVAIGASMIIIMGGIDLSVGSIVGFTAIISGLLINWGMPIWLACILGILLGLIIGLINGVGITYGKVPPFIMTLGMLGIVRGAALASNSGNGVSGFPFQLGRIASSTILGIPSFIVYVIVLYAIAIVVMTKTKFGRYVYSIGGNVRAAKLSGVNTRLIQLITYGLGGMFAAIGGILLLSRLLYADPNAGGGYELNVIAAVVIGGIGLSGGQGKIYNTLVGALILGILQAGLQMLNMSTFVQLMVIGIVIILAVYFDKRDERMAES